MLKRLLPVLFITLASTLSAQQKIKQPSLKAEYELPGGWEATEFYKGDWDKPGGSSICHCAMSINILKIPGIGDEFDYVNMVVYPSDKKGITDPQRNMVWQYKIVHGEGGDSLKTSHLKWKQFQGKIVYTGEHRFKDNITLTYQTNNGKVYYTVHFWGKASILSQYKGVIDKIMKSFKPL
jgi:hypothetical protein